MTREEPFLAAALHMSVLAHEKLEGALSLLLAQKLGSAALSETAVRDILADAFLADASIGAAIRADIAAVYDRDPACVSHLEPLLYAKGFHALEAYRAAHHYWKAGRHALARYLQNRVSEVFAVDIHPAARIGKGIMIDHGTGVVVGETTIIEDDVSILQNVTLGGTGKDSGDRHPKIRRGALLCAGAKILGNIEIGECSKVGAASVVLKDVPACSTAVGVPAKIVASCCEHPSHAMDQSLPDA